MSLKIKGLTFQQLSKMSKKIVLGVQLNCEKCKRKAMKTVARVEGVQSVTIDGKDNKITVIGDADPVCLTTSLRKFGMAELVSVGPSKGPDEKKPEADKKQPEKPNVKVFLPGSVYHGFSDENPNACAIL